MSTLTEYAERVSKRYGALERVDQSTVPWDEGYVPLYARRGPRRAGQDWAQFQEELQGARNRVHEEQIKELLSKQAELELLWTVPYGVPVPIADVVRAERRLVLIAEPGAGKTTALRYLAAHRPVSRMRATAEGRIEQEELIPVLVDLPELGDSSLPEYLSGEAGIQSTELAPENDELT